jgi:alpha-glucuronidase
VNLQNEDGYELWLRYRQINDPDKLAHYRQAINQVVILGKGPTTAIIRRELKRALPVLLGSNIPFSEQKPVGKALVMGTVQELEANGVTLPPATSQQLGEAGFMIRANGDGLIVMAGNEATAVLHATFHFLRLLQTHQSLHGLNIISLPRIRHRILAHWDNLDGSIERGYAGQSLWQWHDLPQTLDPRYHDYARAGAACANNATCVNN